MSRDNKTDAERGIKKFVFRMGLDLDKRVSDLARSEERAKNPMLLILLKEALDARRGNKSVEISIERGNPVMYQGKLGIIERFYLATREVDGLDEATLRAEVAVVEVLGKAPVLRTVWLDELTPYRYTPKSTQVVEEPDGFKEATPVPQELL